MMRDQSVCCGGQQQPRAVAALPPSVPRTFHKRTLPVPPAVPFSSVEGRRIFQEALAAGTMESFFELVEQFSTQDEPAFCGLASLAMVLNALAVDPRQAWKGAWRWFHEALLDCCRPLEDIKRDGINLDQPSEVHPMQAACLASCNGALASLTHHEAGNLEQLRQDVHTACSGLGRHVVVSYSRKGLLQTGDGHFSPIGGYHAAQDLVLILDTARFKYPPHWVPLGKLHAAMQALDSSTGRPRGWLVLTQRPEPLSVMFTLNASSRHAQEGHHAATTLIRSRTAALLQASGQASADRVLEEAVRTCSLAAAQAFVSVRGSNAGCQDDGACRQYGAEQQLLLELRSLPLYPQVCSVLGAALPDLSSQDCAAADQMALLLLLASWPEDLQNRQGGGEVQKLLDLSQAQVVAAEVQYLQQQLRNLPEWHPGSET